MLTKWFAGVVCLSCAATGCATKDYRGLASSDTSSITIPPLWDAGNVGQLIGGRRSLTPAELTAIQGTSCTVAASDAGLSPLSDATSGNCRYAVPKPVVDASGPTDVTQISVVVRVDSEQIWLIGESGLNCPNGDGWYPADVFAVALCPQTCATVASGARNSVQIYVPCVPVILP